jgi:hypothetical protein
VTAGEPEASRDRFARAAVEWAGGARGQILVDAAALALAEGLDSPTLRVLAGAPRASADEEATELAPTVFEELGLHVQPRLSAGAIVEAARLVASDLVRCHGTPRSSTSVLCRMYVAADYPAELADFSGFDDWYDMLDRGIVSGSVAEVDAAVVAAAKRLAAHEAAAPFSIAGPFLGRPPGED